MSWQTLILLSSFLIALALIIVRVLARDKKTAKASIALNSAQSIFLFGVFLIFVPWLGQVHSSFFGHYWLRILGGGLAFGLTNVFTYKTLVYFDAAMGTIAGSVNSLFTIIISALFLHEDLSLIQALGAIVLMSAISYGVVATQYSPKKANHKTVILGTVFALLVGLT